MAQPAFAIVAIGASAGGLEAVSELLAAVPSKSGLAFIVVQHLDPNHESVLSELLGKKTTMRVLPAHEGLALTPDHVYVIPPNATLTVQHDRLHLTPRAGGPPHHPADALFKSLAESRGGSAIAVILSGGDSDGAVGIQEIKHSGGITFAQEPTTARFPSMPRSAIDTGCVDFVLRPNQIARELVRLGGHPYLRLVNDPSAQTNEEPPEPPTAAEEDSLRRIFRKLRSAHGVDFTHYKRSTLRRRLARRMALQKIEDPVEYVALIEADPTEAATLYQDFLIRVTGFFRDPDSFEGLAQRVFPTLCESHTPKQPIRLWIPGCATGEEVYSIAIALVEYLGERHMGESIQIFGTDVSEVAIEKARAGLYLDTILQDLSSERLARFFVKQDDHYRIAKSIRDLCIFARQDVTRDPPFSRLNLISCRNLLIYLDPAAQRRVMQIFHYALRPQGFLILGPSESVGQTSDLFELNDKHHRIYTRKSRPSSASVDLVQRGAAPYSRPREVADGELPPFAEADSAQHEADRLLLARFAPASLLVDEALNILQVRGETGPYLELASGAPSLNLHRIVRPELLVEIGPAIQEARDTGAEVRREGLRIDQLRDVSIEVIPLNRGSEERCYLVLFDDGARATSSRRTPGATISALTESEKDRRLAQQEREIASVRAYLQATMEEQAAVKEELKSAHEEVLSANEEFQSTNEELETSKEELQSANEELITTNDELRNRNRELGVLNAEVEKARAVSERSKAVAEQAGAASEQARRYAEAIVDSVREPLLVLDEELKILRANVAYYTEFRESRENTEGRLLYEVADGRWNLASLREKLDAVLTRNEPMTNNEVTQRLSPPDGRILSLSARKIPGDGTRTELILLAIEDVTERKHADSALRDSEDRYRTLFDLGPVAVYSCDVAGVIQNFNRRAAELWGRTPNRGDTDERFCGCFKMFRPDGSLMLHHDCPMADVVSGRLAEVRDGEVILGRPDGSRVVVVVNIQPLKNARGEVTGAINCFYDVTQRKRAEEQLREYAAQLADADRRKNEFLAMLAHELRNPLSPIMHAAHLLRGIHGDATSAKLCEMIGRQTQRMVRVVDELLDVARISRGLIAIKPEPLDFVVVAREAAEASRLRLEQGQHAFSLVLPPEPVHVTGDPVRLEQVVCNLLENAAKYTDPRGQIILTLTQQGAEAILSVRDTGIGLDPAMLEGIFDLFTQVDRTLARSKGGLGLGLAVVRRILELHGGRIEARSAGLGRGSEFIVRLPVLATPNALLPPPRPQVPGDASGARRILVVDDNADSAQSMVLLARSWGHKVISAQDGDSALRLAESFRPDAALVDIGLPGMDGYELARRLRRAPQHQRMHLVAMTGYGRDEDRDAARAAGFDVHMVKPAEIEKLQQLLANGRGASEIE